MTMNKLVTQRLWWSLLIATELLFKRLFMIYLSDIRSGGKCIIYFAFVGLKYYLYMGTLMGMLLTKKAIV